MVDYTITIGDETFLTLTDSPTTYSGQANKGIRVNSGETGLEFYNTTEITDSDDITEGSTNLFLTSAERAKLSGIETGATADQVASEVTFTADGDIVSTNVQAAIVEVRDDTDTKLAAKASSSHTHSAADITSGTLADGRIAESNVTQHQAALSITESQIPDLGSYVTSAHTHTAADVTSGTFADGRISESSVTQHEGALTIAESQISDLDHDAIKIRGNTVTTDSKSDGDILVYRTSSGEWELETKPTASGAPAWGDVTGTLSNQTDLQSALDAKAASSHTHAASDITGLTSTAAELNILDGTTATADRVAFFDGSKLTHNSALTWDGADFTIEGTPKIGDQTNAGEVQIFGDSGQPTVKLTGFQSGNASINTASGSNRFLKIENTGAGALVAWITGGLTTDGVTIIDNFLDEDNMATDSATALASQQSIKAYTDSATSKISSTPVTAGQVIYADGTNFTSSSDVSFASNILSVNNAIKITPQGSSPTAAEGTLYADSGDNNLYYYDGSNWVDLTGGSGSGITFNTGSGVPSSAASAAGDMYKDTSSDELYIAIGTDSSFDYQKIAAGKDFYSQEEIDLLLNTKADKFPEHVIPKIYFSSGAPGFVPKKRGDICVDETNGKVYISTDDQATGDWKVLN